LSETSRRDALERAGEEEVQQQRLDKVVRVVAERDLAGADLVGDPVQHAAPQPGAQRTRRLVGVEDVLDELANAGVLDPVFPPVRLARARDHVVLVFLVTRVHVDGDEREADRRALAQHVEHLQQRPAVLPPDSPTITRSPSSIIW
jgi:hypothetical protein